MTIHDVAHIHDNGERLKFEPWVIRSASRAFCWSGDASLECLNEMSAPPVDRATSHFAASNTVTPQVQTSSPWENSMIHFNGPQAARRELSRAESPPNAAVIPLLPNVGTFPTPTDLFLPRATTDAPRTPSPDTNSVSFCALTHSLI